ncbi:MAG TPA: DNA gyrase C-terminal beta-propeller domain-containing protein [Thermodesulfobacteriota bacterium]|nr:DNA gyrase C-terminal beta-propeller domain-containing protein [Thermodesulfobacteriota bacterium]
MNCVNSTGKGRILIRGKAEIEEIGQGKSAIIITELPYQVNKALLVARIAELVKEKKLDGISDLRDESDRHGIRVVVELKRDSAPKKILNNLYKLTSLQTTFSANVVALVDDTPQTLNLKTILEEYVKHRYLVVEKRSEFELRQAKARLHILEGLKIAVDNLDAVIKTIRESKTQDDAKANLMKRFKLSDLQATAILDLQLRRLAALERQKIEDEYKMVKETIDYLEDLLAHPEKILAVVKDESAYLKEKYADERRTKVYKGKVGEFSEEDLIPNEPTVITLTTTGYIKRQSLTSFRTQQRGGKGVKGMTTKDEDGILHIRYVMTHDNILFFTNRGKVYQTKAYEIDESSRTSKGTAVVNLINIETGEKVESFISHSKTNAFKNVFLTTRNGTVKKTSHAEFENIRRSGIVAIKLEKGDELVWSNPTTGDDDIFVFTRDGKCIRFNEKDVRPLGRATMGVRGIKLGKDDQVVGMDVVKKGDNPLFLTIMENGYGKKTEAGAYNKQSRGGMGVKIAEVTKKTGKVSSSQIIPANAKEVIITSTKGQVVRLDINSIPKLSRATQGVILMRFSKEGDKVAAITCVE